MSARLLLGSFESEKGTLAAVAEARRRGYPIADVFTPYPVHGLETAMGLAPSWLGRACFVLGLAGFAAAMTLQTWTHSVDWPINVGGRPFNAWPAYMPVAFEVMVLLAGIGTVLLFFVVSRLYPGKRARVLDPQSTDSRFLIAIEAEGAATDTRAVLAMLRSCGAVVVEEREAAVPDPACPGSGHRILQWGLGLGLAATVFLNLALVRDPADPNPDPLADMASFVAYPSDAPHAALPGGTAAQPPREGTIARGRMPFHYEATPEDAERAGRELSNPFAVSDADRLRRGAEIYARFCAVCHGHDGTGGGPVTRRGVPPPPSLVDGPSAKMPEGRLYHVLTHGQGNMAPYAAQIPPEDRWAVILHVLKLQNR